MDTIIVKPKNKEELELVFSYLKRKNIRSVLQKKESLKKKKAKAEFLESLEERLKEVQLHMEGKIELKDAREILNEL
jgi:hypothetical protein